MNHPLPWLRYVDANRITAPDLSLDGMKVRNDEMETLGTVQGFVVDNSSMRPYYVVVDSGGWFKSKEFLLPIGHARIDDDRDALVVDIPKQRIDRFPGFDRDEFERLSETDVKRMNDQICQACNDSDVSYADGDPMSAAWGRADYQQPEWWVAVVTTEVSEPMQRGDSAIGRSTAAMPDRSQGKVGRALGDLQAERELERDRQHQTEADRELVTARESDPSPHFDGRAQPGDVIGLETGGERTYIGETAEDENKRRIDAEQAYREDEKKDRKKS